LEAIVCHLLVDQPGFDRFAGQTRTTHVTARPAPLVRTEGGDFLVVLGSTPHAVDDAHADPEVMAVWEQKAQLEYLAPRALAGIEAPFARWTVVADL
jgi:hypothetical protein